MKWFIESVIIYFSIAKRNYGKLKSLLTNIKDFSSIALAKTVKHTEKSNSTTCRFMLLPLGFTRQFRRLVECSKKDDCRNVFVVFSNETKEHLKSLDVEVFEFQELWTNFEIDIKIHEYIQKTYAEEFKKLPLMKVEFYQFMVFLERFFFLTKSSENSSLLQVTYVFDYSALISLPISLLLEGTASRGYNIELISGSLEQNFFNAVKLLRFLRKIFLWSSLKTTIVKAIKQISALKPFLSRRLSFICRRFSFICGRFYRKNTNVSDFKASQNIMEPSIGIFFSGEFNSKYWRTLIKVVEVLRFRNANYICFTESFFNYIILKIYQIQTIYIKPVAKFDGPVRENSNVAELEMVVSRAFKRYYIQREEVYNIILSLVKEYNINTALLIPHWSAFGSILFALPKTSLRLISLPVVSVAGNAASIIGWETLDEIYCYGEQCVSAFKEMNFPTERLKLCGNLLLDDYLRKNTSSDNKSILIATSRLDPNENIWIEKIIEYAIKQNYKCVIKIHPSFSKKDYSSFKKYSKHVKLITQERELYILISNCAVCITDCSTVGAEAVLLGKLLLVVNLIGKEFRVNQYSKLGVALEAKTLQDVCELLDKTLNDSTTHMFFKSNIEKFKDLYNYKNDGNACERFVDGLLNYTGLEITNG